MAEHAVGNKIVMCGTIVAIDGDVALVQVDKAFPAGGTVTVRLGKLPDGAGYGPAHQAERRRRLRLTR